MVCIKSRSFSPIFLQHMLFIVFRDRFVAKITNTEVNLTNLLGHCSLAWEPKVMDSSLIILAWELYLGIFNLGTLASELWLGNFSSGALAWEL